MQLFSDLYSELFLETVIELRLLQPAYLEVTDYQLFMVNTVEKWIGFYLKV